MNDFTIKPSLQAKPKEVQASRDFAETRKLALAANDLVTLVEHRWAGLTLQNKNFKRHNGPFVKMKQRLRKEFQLSPWKH